VTSPQPSVQRLRISCVAKSSNRGTCALTGWSLLVHSLPPRNSVESCRSWLPLAAVPKDASKGAERAMSLHFILCSSYLAMSSSMFRFNVHVPHIDTTHLYALQAPRIGEIMGSRQEDGVEDGQPAVIKGDGFDPER